MPNGERQEALLAKSSGRLLLLTLNRPQKLAALSKELLERFAACLADAERNDAIGTVVLTARVEPSRPAPRSATCLPEASHTTRIPGG